MSNDIREMEIADYSIIQNIKCTFYRLWKLKFVVVLATIITIALAEIYLIISDESFSFYSNATIYSAVYGSYSETVSGITIMNTYSGILGSSRVCDRAAAEISNSQISSEYLQNLVGSGKIYISGASTESRSYGYRLQLIAKLDKPDYVVEITNAMANAFSSELNELLGGDIVQVFDPAKNSFMQSARSNSVILLIGAAVGFVLSIGIICVKEFLSSKVYIVSQCEMDKDRILGIIPINK